MEFNGYANDLLDDDKFSNDVLTIEDLEQLATELALNLKINQKLKTNIDLLSDVKKISNELLAGYLLLIQDIEKHNITPATEWFLDNFHIIEEQSRSIKRDLPKGFYDELPKVCQGQFALDPRVFAIALTYTINTDAKINSDSIVRFVNSYQKVTPLTIGELWAVAISIRIALIKCLHPLVQRNIIASIKRNEADSLADELLTLATSRGTTANDLLELLSKRIDKLEKLNRPFMVQLIQRLREQDPIVSKSFDWLEMLLTSCNSSTNEIVQLEHHRQAAVQVTIGNIISSMRLISEIDWNMIIEQVSPIDPILRQDPSQAYILMDLSTKDSYRKIIEKIAKRSKFSEIEVTQKAYELCQKQQAEKKHIGYYLLGKGVIELEQILNYQSPLGEKLARLNQKKPAFIYFGGLTLLSFSFMFLILSTLQLLDKSSSMIIAMGLILLLPITDISVNILNYVTTLFRVPTKLPRLETQKGIRAQDQSMIIVPCLLSNIETIRELVSNLEVQYLANQDEHIYFAILGDLNDAAIETQASDHNLLYEINQGIENLNRRYSSGTHPRFYSFHRARIYNKSEEKWMCWERKRGKVMEFNHLLRGDKKTTFLNTNIDYEFLQRIKYVITLDADTQLPLHCARRLIGTITHPLNQPIYCPKSDRIVSGFGILQPRISISVTSSNKTRFSKIFSGNTGIDPYTTAVSDVYQDLFGEGSFTGKGLYVVDAFEKVIGKRIAENRVLSHDLLEGNYARVGLTTDLELIDDYPIGYDIFAKRMHRWTRGDWQIILWLLPYVPNEKNEWVRNKLPFIARWKIFDNFRRSLLMPVTLMWLILSWTILAGGSFNWTIIIMTFMSFSVFIPSLTDVYKRNQNSLLEHIGSCFIEFNKRIKQVILTVIFMPSIAITQLDAIIRTLYRMTISKKNMLEWVTFSQTQQQSQKHSFSNQILSAGPLVAIACIILIIFLRPLSLIVAAPFIICWILAPWISHWTKQPAKPKTRPLKAEEINQFRLFARKTWHFFEHFCGHDNNWLAPDNFQEEPEQVIATRTSPTNIGLHILSIHSAYDMGYIGYVELVELLEKTFSSILKLEKYEGHFFNWYDTVTLSPLYPRYISTVDSGNLAGHLVVARQACLKLAKSKCINPQRKHGFADSIKILMEKIDLQQSKFPLKYGGALNKIKEINASILILLDSDDWNNIITAMTKVREIIVQMEHDDSLELVQWIDSTQLQAKSFYTDQNNLDMSLFKRLEQIANHCQEINKEMNFSFLFEQERKVFAIGFNVSERIRDNSYYDLLASEARLASFIAIAKGDIPDQHWFRLGRQLTKVIGGRALISWSASMFEYLMPLLVMKRYQGTLLDQTYDSIVLRQIEYGEQRNVPWGVSESGYNARDLNFNYQYGPFGVPGLGLKRGLRDELVISPYSTILASMIFPIQALANLKRLKKMNALGQYGFHESIDYTPERKHKDEKYIILKSYMAHHQGMSLISINNLVNNFIMQRRFHSDPTVKAVELLLQEKIPPLTPIIKPRAEETHIEHLPRFHDDPQTRVYSNPSQSTPRTHIISNGNYSVMMTSAGSGFSKCEERMVTRWREDSTMDHWGQFIYVQNMSNQKVWSVGHRPTNVKSKKYEVHFSEEKIEIRREDQGIITHTEIIVSSEDNVEMRRVSLTNNTKETVEIEVTSYMEVVLTQAKDDHAHPAFSNLFIETEFCHKSKSLLAQRRLRSKDEMEVWGFHILAPDANAIGPIQYETDRGRFLGRGRSTCDPIVLSNEIDLSGTTGAVLDPIFSLSQRVKIAPRQTAKLIYSTGLVHSRIEAQRLLTKYHDTNTFARQINMGWIKAQINLRHLNIPTKKAQLYQRLAGRILYLSPYLRVQTNEILNNQKTQCALWTYGISGDLPIILTRIQDEKDMDMIKELLRAHEYLRLKGLKIDLLILNEHSTSYLQNLQDELMRQILISGSHPLLDKPGGIFIRRADLIPHDDIVLLKTVARIRLIASKGTLSEQLRRRPTEVEFASPFIPVSQSRDYPRANFQQPDLICFNGLGGFTPDQKEYVIILKEEQQTPAPWINVIANKNDFGFIISESGQGYTWSINSRENRISPWANDSVTDPVSEAMYIRDEDTGTYWTPTPLPIRSSEPYLIKHGQGYSKFLHDSHGLSQELTTFVAKDDAVKIMRLKIKNIDTKLRRISITSYIDWVIGFSKAQSAQTLTTTWDEETQSIFAKNSYNNEFSHRISFLNHVENFSSFTCDRKEFIGRNCSMKTPQALSRKNLSGKYGGGLDACGAIQSIFSVKPNEEMEMTVLIGQGDNQEEVKKLIMKYKQIGMIETAFTEMQHEWNETLNAISIETPDESMNILFNRWLLYQNLSCRIWARTAFYQSGGAYGFRDQLQDVMAMVYANPEIARSHIKLAASRQFPEGDVQHWWHPPTGRGVRTRFSDDLLWLPYTVSHYINITGDSTILDETISFIEAPLLDENHDDSYTQPNESEEVASLLEHCLRTIDRSLKVGGHGLPLMGSGDWNDGMSTVGNKGKGESVWMAWFLIKTLKEFIPHCHNKVEQSKITNYQSHVEKLKQSIDENAWDGQWYLRAFFDNGEMMGSHKNEECKIDSIAQSWSILSGAGNQERSKMALSAVNQNLIDHDEKIIKLFTPPFDKGLQEPGYIKGYLPGVRENGGQYTHAAIWTMMAYAQSGDGDMAAKLYQHLNPINRTSTRTGLQKYKVEPYVIAADIYSMEPHIGRGGWSWYTGSASWMYRATLESILGFKLENNTLSVNPSIPKNWPKFTIRYRYKTATYNIEVLNNQAKSSIKIDGVIIEDKVINLIDDGLIHEVCVMIHAFVT